MTYNQNEYDIRLEWGQKGVEELSAISDVVIIIDILSFSTCVDIVTSNLASVIPYNGKTKLQLNLRKVKMRFLQTIDDNIQRPIPFHQHRCLP